MIVVENHHEVLLAWAEVRRSLPKAPRLLTLDHHTDTSKPFRNFLKKMQAPESQREEWLKAIDFRDPKSVQDAIAKLSHDEHVVTAIQSDIISSALVIAQNSYDTDLATYKEHRIICREVPRSDYDNVIEASFLNSKLSSFDALLQIANESRFFENPFILDIDLDYFNTQNSYAPKDPSALKRLADQAVLVTVATEPKHVKTCAVEPDVTSERILSALTSII